MATSRDECALSQNEARAPHEAHGTNCREVFEFAREPGSGPQGTHEECQVQGQSTGMDAYGHFPQHGQVENVHSHARRF